MVAFHISDILSVSTGRWLSLRGGSGLYDILNYMTGGNLFTHQLPRALDECEPHIKAQLPWLHEIDDSNVNESNWREWVLKQEMKYGPYHEVSPLAKGEHLFINPVAEAEALMGFDKVIPIVVEKDAEAEQR